MPAMRWAPATLIFVAIATAAPPVSAHIGLQPQTIDILHPPGAALPLDLESLFALFISEDGLTWRFTCHEALLADPSNPGTLLPRYVRTGDASLLVTMGTTAIGFVADESVYRSTDGGCDWSAPSGLTGRTVTDLAVLDDGSTVLAVTGDIGGDNGLYLSTDGGATFGPSDTTGLPGYFLNVVTGSGGAAWAASADAAQGTATLYRTADSGATWVAVPFDAPVEGSAPTNYAVLAVDPADADHVHVASAGQSFDYVHRSVDGGQGWTEIHQNASTFNDAVWSDGQLIAAVASLRPVIGDGSALETDTSFPFSEGVARTPDGLYLATNALLEDTAIVRMDADPVVLLGFVDITEELVCPAGTRHADVCSAIWPDAAVVLSLFGDNGDDDDSTPGDDDDTAGPGPCACATSGADVPTLSLLLPAALWWRRQR